MIENIPIPVSNLHKGCITVLLKLAEQNVQGRTVLTRANMNVSFKGGRISDDIRIHASFAPIKYCLDNDAPVTVMTHLGRSTEGEPHPEDDVTSVAAHLDSLLGKDVKVLNDWHENKPALNAGDVVMLQNVRINRGEEESDLELGKAYTTLCDVFANDVFGTAHRAQAPTEVVVQAVPVACAGVLMASELDALGEALKRPARPMVVTVTGSRVSTKLTILESLTDKVDQFIVDGGIASIFLSVGGKAIGKSLAEYDLVGRFKKIMTRMAAKSGSVPLLTDVIVAKAFAADTEAVVKDIAGVAGDDMILSIGPKFATALAELLKVANTVVWNGPVDVFEFDQFAGGAKALAEAIAQSRAFSITGDDDTLAAIAKFGVTNQVGYISTGGDALLEFLESKELPAVITLEKRGT